MQIKHLDKKDIGVKLMTASLVSRARLQNIRSVMQKQQKDETIVTYRQCNILRLVNKYSIKINPKKINSREI